MPYILQDEYSICHSTHTSYIWLWYYKILELSSIEVLAIQLPFGIVLVVLNAVLTWLLTKKPNSLTLNPVCYKYSDINNFLFFSFILFYFFGFYFSFSLLYWKDNEEGTWQGGHMTGHMMWCHKNLVEESRRWCQGTWRIHGGLE